MGKTTVITKEQLNAQLAFCEEIKAYWHSRNTTPTAYVETYGCQQNEADSERIRGLLIESGYAITDSAEGT
ncbi:MAG: tRNA (N6-isopentenyl adenosine(37)-C2)-methylthiotransferase MiaB, partial [Oscillospiraceae bacterium]|nr:tRNA (N6-isopentenyl adenosine(37)-C2)-methylthiotransferase MiaB [Oscillospiraceae bacterium]